MTSRNTRNERDALAIISGGIEQMNENKECVPPEEVAQLVNYALESSNVDSDVLQIELTD